MRSLSRYWAVTLGVLPSAAWALVTGETADKVADVLAVFVIIFVPIAAIYVFWKIHILPEQIAERRHHPQKDAIRVLCLLSLVFGGLLWPIAWLWAYTKPTLHKLAYGTDKHEDAETSVIASPPPSDTKSLARLDNQLADLRRDIDRLLEQGAPVEDVDLLRRDLARIEKTLTRPSRQEAH